MTIDETIKHCEEVVKKHTKYNIYGGFESLDECGEEHRQFAEWLKELKSLKEKDEPKAVRYEGDGYADGAIVYDTAFCPNCNHEFEEDSENWECEFCPNCGQRLRWEK